MLVAIPALNDNYIWLYRRENLPAIVVDLPETEGLFALLEEQQIAVEALLLTHYHDDHTQGVMAFKRRFPDVPVYGPQECANKGADRILTDGCFSTEHYEIEAIASPGHTAGHLSYLLDGNLFCGDALFSAGCGRVFTNDYAAAFATLQRFKQLPAETQICAAHEYTLGNLAFAESVLGELPAIQQHKVWVEQQRAEHRPSLPTSLALEQQINPFLQATDLAEFTRLREMKDHF